MKKLFAIVAVMGALTFGSTQLAQAQEKLSLRLKAVSTRN